MDNKKENIETLQTANSLVSSRRERLVFRERKFSLKPSRSVQETIDHSRRWRMDVNYHWNTGEDK